MSMITVIPSYRTREGGFEIRRTFPSQVLDYLNPFLLLDYFGPMDVAPGSKPGVSDHPHRGFQTVTYIVDGEVEHNDSRGNHGIIKPGGLQWMSAGSGIIHSEFPSNALSEQGGILKGIQLWVNLPAEVKMTDSTYQDLSSDELPLIEHDNYSLRIIAGTYESKTSPVSTHTPLLIAHLELDNSSFAYTITEGFSTGLLVLDGEIEVSDTTGNFKTGLESELIVIEGSPKIMIKSSKKANIIILSGQPIDEPIARYGPFVMNSTGEIKQALLDYQSGKLK